MNSMPAAKLRSRNSDGRTNSSRAVKVDQEQVEGRGGDDGLDPDLRRAEPVAFLAAVEQDLHGADREAQGAEPNQSSLAPALRPLSGRKAIMPRKASTPTGRLM